MSIFQFSTSMTWLLFLVQSCMGSMVRSGLPLSDEKPLLPLNDEKSFRKALAADPNDAQTRAAYGRWLGTQERLVEAVFEAKAAVAASPRDATLRRDLALMYAQGGEFADADAMFAEAIEMGACPDLYLSHANFLLERQDIARAKIAYENAAAHITRDHAKSTEEAHVLVEYARFLEGVQRDLDGANKQYLRAISVDRSPSVLIGFAGFLRHVRKDYRGAEDAYREALSLDPMHADTLRAYGTFLQVIRRDYEGAEALFARAVEDPSDGKSRHIYAKFLGLVRREYSHMAVIAREAVALEPEFASHWEHVTSWDDTTQDAEGCLSRFDAADTSACMLLLLAETVYAFFKGILWD